MRMIELPPVLFMSRIRPVISTLSGLLCLAVRC